MEIKIDNILCKYSLEFDDRSEMKKELLKLFYEQELKCMACEKVITRKEALVFCGECGL